ncbi:hypothetical protein GXP70_04530 [Paenibacillus lycopersici]|uniref:Uncharacterized protein n=1 Tax=Paenibacillus lycopersici TaxID=2704462 RepID=A0A6C0FR01_9BACL|nr:hypothetical protein [Paenibacillus lycopersici]QHT59307.1 hypothetical protein GXP70_04530 [Paenibacillus lycopersici]
MSFGTLPNRICSGGGIELKKPSLSLAVPLLGLALVLSACSTVKSFEDTIDTVNDHEFLVNCSDEVNRGKHGDADDIGYLCRIEITGNTKLNDADGNPLKFEDFVHGDTIRISFPKGVNISSSHRKFDAAEIVRLAQAE